MSEKPFCRVCVKEFLSQAELFSHNLSFEHVSRSDRSVQEQTNSKKPSAPAKPATKTPHLPSYANKQVSNFSRKPSTPTKPAAKTPHLPTTSSAPKHRNPVHINQWRHRPPHASVFGPCPGPPPGLPPGPLPGLPPGPPHGLVRAPPHGLPPGPPPGLPPRPPSLNPHHPVANFPSPAPPGPTCIDFTVDSIPSRGEKGSFARKKQIRRGGRARHHSLQSQFMAAIADSRIVLADQGLEPEFSYPATRGDFNLYRRVMQSCLKRKVNPTRAKTKQFSPRRRKPQLASSAGSPSGTTSRKNELPVSTAQSKNAMPPSNNAYCQTETQQGSSPSSSSPSVATPSITPVSKSGSEAIPVPAKTSSLPKGTQQGSKASGISMPPVSTASTSGKSASCSKLGSLNVKPQLVKRLQEANRPRTTSLHSGLSATVNAKNSGTVSATKILKKAKDTKSSILAGKRPPIVDDVPRLLPPLAASRLRRKIPGSEIIVQPNLSFPDGMDFLPLEIKTEQEKSGNGTKLPVKISVASSVQPLSSALAQPQSEILLPKSEPRTDGSVNTSNNLQQSYGSHDPCSSLPPPPAQRVSSQESLLAGEPLQMDLDTDESSPELFSPIHPADAAPRTSAPDSHPSSVSEPAVSTDLSTVVVTVPLSVASQTKLIVSSFETALPPATGTTSISWTRNFTKFLKDTSLVLASVRDSERNTQPRQVPSLMAASNSSTVSSLTVSDQAQQSSTPSSNQSSVNGMIERILQNMQNYLPVQQHQAPNLPTTSNSSTVSSLSISDQAHTPSSSVLSPSTISPMVEKVLQDMHNCLLVRTPPSKQESETASTISTPPGSKKRKSTAPKRRATTPNDTSSEEKQGESKSGTPNAAPSMKCGAKAPESGQQKRKRSSDAAMPKDSAPPAEDLTAGGSIQESLKRRVFSEARKLQALGCPLPHQKQNKKISQNLITSLGQRPRKSSESDIDANPLSPSTAAASAPLSPSKAASARPEPRLSRRQSSSSAVCLDDGAVANPTEVTNTIIVTVGDSLIPEIHPNPTTNPAVPRSGHNMQLSKSSASDSTPSRAKSTAGSAKKPRGEKTAATSTARRSSVQSSRASEGSNQDVSDSVPAAVAASSLAKNASSKPSRPDTLPGSTRKNLQQTSSERVRSPLLHSQTASLSSAPPLALVKIEPLSPTTEATVGGHSNIPSGGPPATAISLEVNTGSKCTWQRCNKPVHHLSAKLCLEHDKFVDSIMTRLKSSRSTSASSSASTDTPRDITAANPQPVLFGEIADAPSWLGLPSEDVEMTDPSSSRSALACKDPQKMATESDRRGRPSESAKLPSLVLPKPGTAKLPSEGPRTNLSPRSRGATTPSGSTTSGGPTDSSGILSQKLPKTGKRKAAPYQESGSEGLTGRGTSSTASPANSPGGLGVPLAKKQRQASPSSPETNSDVIRGVATPPLPATSTPRQDFMAKITALNSREQQLQTELMSGQSELCEVCEKVEGTEKELGELRAREQQLQGQVQQLTSESLEVLGQKQNVLLHSSTKGGGGVSARAQGGSEGPSTTHSHSFQSEMASLNQREQQLQTELLSGQSELYEVCEKVEGTEKELGELRAREQQLQELCNKLTSDYKEVLAWKQNLLLQPLQRTPSPLHRVAGGAKSSADGLGNARHRRGNEANPVSNSSGLESNPGGKKENDLNPLGGSGFEGDVGNRRVDDSNPEDQIRVESHPGGREPDLTQPLQREGESEGGHAVRTASEHSHPVPQPSESPEGSQRGRSQPKETGMCETITSVKSSPTPSRSRVDAVVTTEQEKASSDQQTYLDSTAPLTPLHTLGPPPLVHLVASPPSDTGLQLEEILESLNTEVSRTPTDINRADASDKTTERESVPAQGGGAKDKGLPQGVGKVQETIEKLQSESTSSGGAACKEVNGGSAETVPKFEPHASSVLSMKISSNRLYTCSADKTVRVYNLQTGAIEQQYKDHQRSVTCLELFTAHGTTYLLTGSSDKMIHMYNTTNEKLEAKFKCGVRVMYLSVYEAMLFVGLSSGSVIVIDLELNRCIGRHGCHQSQARSSISCLCSCEGRLFTAAFDMKVACWEVALQHRGGVSFNLVRQLTSFEHTVLCMKIHDGLLYSGCGDATVQVHNTKTWDLVHVITAHGGAVSGLQILGKVLITACFDKLVRCFDIERLELLQVYAGNTDMVFTICTANGLIYTGLKDGTVQANKLDLTVFHQCQWQDCGLRFGVWDHLREHVKDHSEQWTTTSIFSNILTCRWEGCNRTVERPLMTAHLQLHISNCQGQ